MPNSRSSRLRWAALAKHPAGEPAGTRAAELLELMLVEDERLLRTQLSLILKTAHYSVLEASSGEAALDLWRERHPRLIVADWLMEGGSGLDLIRAIRADPFPAYTYIIMLTSQIRKEDVAKGLDAGADDYIVKPADVGELRGRIRIGERILALESDLRAALAKAEEQATHDRLTGLYNRVAMDEHIGAEWSRAARDGTPVSLVLMDIDFFKRVNDTHGHQVGDQALQAVADVLRHGARAYDVIARWGGEEFLGLLPKTGPEDALVVAERFRMGVTLRNVSLPAGGNLSLHISAGVATATFLPGQGGVPFDQLLGQADAALYEAKAEGRNRVMAAR